MIKEFFKSVSNARIAASYLEGVQTPEELQKRVVELQAKGYI